MRRVAGHAYAHPALVGAHVVGSVGGDLPEPRQGEVVAEDLGGLACGPPLATAVGEPAHGLLLLAVDRDYRSARRQPRRVKEANAVIGTPLATLGVGL